MRRDKVDLLNGVLKVLAKNGDPLEYMRELGYKYPQQAWADLRNWANAHNMNQGRLPGDLRKYYARIRADKPGNVAPDEKPGEHQAEAEKAPETVTLGGKTYELFVRDEKPDGTVTDRKITTCCAPAPPSGVTVPDELPEESLKIAALLSSFDPDFRYELSNIKSVKDRVVSLIWREPLGGGERSLNLTTDEWQLFAKEIPRMLKQLGLI